MLAIIVSDTTLDIPHDFSLNLKLKSPIFHDQGGYTYPFKIPSTLRNRNTLGFIHRIESNSSKYEDFECKITWKGIILHHGILRIKIADDKWYEGSIYVDDGMSCYKMKNKYIQQYNLGEKEFSDADEAIAYFNACKGFYFPDRDFALPEIYNELYLDPPATDPYQLYYNWYVESTWDLVLKKPGTEIRTILIPFLFMKYALKKLFNELEYSFYDEFFTHPDYNKLVIYNSLNCNSPERLDYYVNHLLYNAHLPLLSVTDFMKGIESFWNCRFFINEKKKQITLKSLKDIVLDGSSIEFSKNIISKGVSLEDKILGYKLTMTPDGDDDAFMEMVELEEEYKKNMKGAVEAIDDLPAWPVAEISELRYVISEDEYYMLYPNKTWGIYPYGVLIWNSGFNYKGETESLDTSFSTLRMSVPLDDYMACGNKFNNWREITSRVIFADLLIDGERSKVVGKNETDNFSLFYPGEKGLFVKYFKDFMDWRMSAIRSEITKQMDYIELHDFDFSRKYMILGIKYLISELSVTLTQTEIKPAKLICYTCP